MHAPEAAQGTTIPCPTANIAAANQHQTRQHPSLPILQQIDMGATQVEKGCEDTIIVLPIREDKICLSSGILNIAPSLY